MRHQDRYIGINKNLCGDITPNKVRCRPLKIFEIFDVERDLVSVSIWFLYTNVMLVVY